MAEKIKLELVTPYKRVLSEEVDEVTAPGSIGEFGVLPDHTSLLTTLKVGDLSYKQDGETFHVAVNWGYVEVEDDVMTVLVETAEPVPNALCHSDRWRAAGTKELPAIIATFV